MAAGEKWWVAGCPSCSDVTYILPYFWVREVNIAQFFTLGGVELQAPATSLSESLWRRGKALVVHLYWFGIDTFFFATGHGLLFPRFTYFGALPMVSTSMLHSCRLLWISKLVSFLVLTINSGWLDGTKSWILCADRQVGRTLLEQVSVFVSGLKGKHVNLLYSGRILPERLAWFNVVHQPCLENRAFTS